MEYQFSKEDVGGQATKYKCMVKPAGSPTANPLGYQDVSRIVVYNFLSMARFLRPRSSCKNGSCRALFMRSRFSGSSDPFFFLLRPCIQALTAIGAEPITGPLRMAIIRELATSPYQGLVMEWPCAHKVGTPVTCVTLKE